MPFDLPQIKLLCLHVSEHHDESIVRPIWNQIFEESECHQPPVVGRILNLLCSVLQGTSDVNVQRDLIFKTVSRLGQRFYPSESAFPLRMLSFYLTLP